MNNKNIEFAIDELDYLMVKVARVHGDNHKELIEIKDCYLKIKNAIKDNDLDAAKRYLNIAYELSGGFKLPDDACQAYTRVYEAFKILINELK